MLQFLVNNIGSVVVGLLLALVVTLIVINLVRRKQAGKCVACNSCDGCKSYTCPSKQNKQ